MTEREHCEQMAKRFILGMSGRGLNIMPHDDGVGDDNGNLPTLTAAFARERAAARADGVREGLEMAAREVKSHRYSRRAKPCSRHPRPDQGDAVSDDEKRPQAKVEHLERARAWLYHQRGDVIESLAAEFAAVEEQASESIKLNTEQARRIIEAGDTEREWLAAKLEQARNMFDVTRHRVLRAIGESDMGKSWSWIESELTQVRAEAEGLRKAAHDDKTDDLLDALIDDLLTYHPLPWCTQLDWGVDVLDAAGERVRVFQTTAVAEFFIARAEIVQAKIKIDEESIDAIQSDATE